LLPYLKLKLISTDYSHKNYNYSAAKSAADAHYGSTWQVHHIVFFY